MKETGHLVSSHVRVDSNPGLPNPSLAHLALHHPCSQLNNKSSNLNVCCVGLIVVGELPLEEMQNHNCEYYKPFPVQLAVTESHHQRAMENSWSKEMQCRGNSAIFIRWKGTYPKALLHRTQSYTHMVMLQTLFPQCEMRCVNLKTLLSFVSLGDNQVNDNKNTRGPFTFSSPWAWRVSITGFWDLVLRAFWCV